MSGDNKPFRPVSKPERRLTRLMMLRYLRDHGKGEGLLSDELFAKAVSDETGVFISKTPIAGFRGNTAGTRDEYVRAVQRYLKANGYYISAYVDVQNGPLMISHLYGELFGLQNGYSDADHFFMRKFVSHDRQWVLACSITFSEGISNVAIEMTSQGSQTIRSFLLKGHAAQNQFVLLATMCENLSNALFQFTLLFDQTVPKRVERDDAQALEATIVQLSGAPILQVGVAIRFKHLVEEKME